MQNNARVKTDYLFLNQSALAGTYLYSSRNSS
ncbi:unnamed protein product [Acanthoscelides obtectus]|uniref:Uncharacterized protein n=1 Tax=Acanthoscelides obtectus TaxID=200917 RepID=A0A9P0M4P3_ACAOB|nr:unnamed protein product [Acanthoscelides obtectus]CAK1650681.1 hypothetical protein AOBTE_LOCUS16863 [Acanthoscelides obtectus]